MMKRTFFGGLLAAIGLTKSAAADPSVTTIDPRTILFSMPTIANDAPPLSSFVGEPSDADVIFHEDDWRQLEFFAAVQLPTIQATLTELKAFEAQNRVQSGWRQIYVRRLPSAHVLVGDDAVNSLASVIGTRAEPGPVIFHGAGSIDGRVQDGFSLRLGAGAALYGFSDGAGIPVLGAFLQNADDQLLTNAFLTLNRRHGLVLVDWRAQLVVMSVETNGQVAIWRP